MVSIPLESRRPDEPTKTAQHIRGAPEPPDPMHADPDEIKREPEENGDETNDKHSLDVAQDCFGYGKQALQNEMKQSDENENRSATTPWWNLGIVNFPKGSHFFRHEAAIVTQHGSLRPQPSKSGGFPWHAVVPRLRDGGGKRRLS